MNEKKKKSSDTEFSMFFIPPCESGLSVLVEKDRTLLFLRHSLRLAGFWNNCLINAKARRLSREIIASIEARRASAGIQLMCTLMLSTYPSGNIACVLNPACVLAVLVNVCCCNDEAIIQIEAALVSLSGVYLIENYT